VIEVCTSFAARGVTWLDDQTLVASLGPSDGLVRLPAERGAAVPLTRLDRAKGESTHRWPQAAPGGEAVIYTASDVNGGYDDARIEAVSAKTGRRAVLHRGGYGGRYLASGHVVFVRHETLFALPVDLGRLVATGPAVPVVDGVLGDPIMGRFEFSASRNGTALTLTGYRPAPRDQLSWVTSSGRREPLPLAPDDYVDPRVSPDGRHVVVGVRRGPGPQLLIYERGSDAPHRLVSTTWDLTPIWAPDGQHVVFGAEGEGGIHNLYWRRRMVPAWPTAKSARRPAGTCGPCRSTCATPTTRRRARPFRSSRRRHPKKLRRSRRTGNGWRTSTPRPVAIPTRSTSRVRPIPASAGRLRHGAGIQSGLATGASCCFSRTGR
jgi:hypothetical protein